MSKIVKLEYQNILDQLHPHQLEQFASSTLDAAKQLINHTGKGKEFTGWVDWPVVISDEEIKEIKEEATYIRNNFDTLVVIGIGGSYLGAKAALDMLTTKKDGLEIIFTGNTLSPDEIYDTIEYLQDKNFAINLVSKSGTTIEPGITFRLLRSLLVKKQHKDIKKCIYTTNSHHGALYNMANENGIKQFFIPDDIGGRYSVLTVVGLLPLACAGFNIDEVIAGARSAYHDFTTKPFLENEALLYATLRNYLYSQGKKIELLVSYEPKLHYFGEWWKQLYGESEGKNHLGIFPATAIYSTDLHSLGQYVQDGERTLIETTLLIKNPNKNLQVEKLSDNFDGLDYLVGIDIDQINKQAAAGTIKAHIDGGVPSIVIEIEKADEFHYGYLTYMFMFACGVSGYLLDVNPFDQEGVEAYKRNMFKLLKKPL